MRTIILILTALLSLSVMAQQTLNKLSIKGDELLESPNSTVYYADGFSFTVNEKGEDKYEASLSCDKFDFFTLEKHHTIMIGFYTENDSLLIKMPWECHTMGKAETLHLYPLSQLWTHLDRHLLNKNLCDCKENSLKIDYLWMFLSEAKGYIRLLSSTSRGVKDARVYTILSRKPREVR